MSIKSPRPDPHAASRCTRRGFLGAGLGLPLLAACSSDQESDTSDALKMLGQSFALYTGGGEITRDQAAAVPFASIGVSMGDSAQTLLVLATRSRDTSLWTSAARIAIETQSGRITRTAGLPHNMSQSGTGGSDPLQSGVGRKSGPYQYVIDLPDKNVYGAIVRYEMDLPQPDQIAILGARLKVLHARERGSCSALDWDIENEYWADAKTGFVWRSRQNVHPDMDPLEIVVFRPPA